MAAEWALISSSKCMRQELLSLITSTSSSGYPQLQDYSFVMVQAASFVVNVGSPRARTSASLKTGHF